MNAMPSPDRAVARDETLRFAADGTQSEVETSASPPGCRVEVRESSRESFIEYHFTATVPCSENAANDLLEKVVTVLADRKIQRIQEKLYGRAGVRADVLQRREMVYRQRGIDSGVPVPWIEGAPLHGGDFVGMQIWGIASRDGKTCVWTVENPVSGFGRIWTGSGFEMLHLPAVRGTLPDGILSANPATQATQMFANVGLGLQAHGMTYSNVIRTWIYVSRLLEWYGELNRVRNALFAQVGLGVTGGGAFPASTGIQGRMDEEECLIDVLALKSDGPARALVEPIRCSPRQDQSFNYGSAFSRGMTITIEGRKTVLISGTASINTAGSSTHLGDAEYQSLETVMSIAAILETQGGTLRDIVSATVFCKDQAAWEAWNRVTSLLRIPDFPKICVMADVCRSDLLVEMESIAVI